MTPAELWTRLAAIRSSTLTTEGDVGERHGTGCIEVRRPDLDTIDWEESGAWRGEGERPTPFRDRLRWHRDTDGGILSVHHTRRGDDAPVHLGDLVPGPDGTLRSLAPHLCGADTYDAALQVEEGELVSIWRVKGPSKSYTMVRRYI